jgi:hypothetical protein
MGVLALAPVLAVRLPQAIRSATDNRRSSTDIGNAHGTAAARS